jgi:hypothetical protein
MSKIFAGCFEEVKKKHFKVIHVNSTAELSHDEEELKKQMLNQTIGRAMVEIIREVPNSTIELVGFASSFETVDNEIHMKVDISIMVNDGVPDTLFDALIASTKVENFNELMILVKNAMEGDLGDLGERLNKTKTIDEKLKIIREELDNE